MISLVMSYYDRQHLLDKTMESIERSTVKDFELIIVDDASPKPVVCERADKIITVKPQNKWWHNPCVPYNMGFEEAKGDIVVIQNPECYHVGDILAYVEKNITLGSYISFGCYALNAKETAQFHARHDGYVITEPRTYKHPENNGWYNHPKYRPVGYHFCSAIMKKDLDLLAGFDENYAHGISYDDDDFIRRIKRRGINVVITEFPYVIHQYHTPFTYKKPNYKQLHSINKRLFYG